jgi:hypothetical protein
MYFPGEKNINAKMYIARSMPVSCVGVEERR